MEARISDLSIYPHLRRIADLISKNDLISIIGQDGIGRSLGIPWVISMAGSRVLVSVRDIERAGELSNILSHIDPSITVSSDIGSNNSSVVYSTPDIIRDFLLGGDGVSGYGVLMVEGAYDMSIDDIILVSIWNYYVNKDVEVPRLVVSGNKVSNGLYRLGANMPEGETSLVDVSSYVIDTDNYPVNMVYSGKSYRFTSGGFSISICSVIAKMDSTLRHGNMMVFLPSMVEVSSIAMMLSRYTDTQLITPTSILTSELASKNILLATDDTSPLFTADISIVIDTMLAKVVSFSPSGARYEEVVKVTKQEAKIRANRLGVSTQGMCYRLCSKAFYESLPNQRLDHHKDLYRYVLKLTGSPIPLVNIMGNISRKDIAESAKLMVRLGALSQTAETTDKGRFILEMPLSPRNSSVLWDWMENGFDPYPCIVLMSLIDSYGPSYFRYPLKDLDETFAQYQIRSAKHRDIYFHRFEGRSDIHTLSNLWITLADETAGLKVTDRELSIWSTSNSLNYRQLRRCISTVQNMMASIKSRERAFSTDNLVSSITPFMIEAYADTALTLSSTQFKPIYRGANLSDIYVLDNKRSINSMLSDPPLKLLGIFTYATKGRSSGVNIIGLGLSIKDSPERPPSLTYTQASRRTSFSDAITAGETLPL